MSVIEEIKAFLESIKDANGQSVYINIDLERFAVNAKRKEGDNQCRICIANAENPGIGINQSHSEAIFQIRVKNTDQKKARDILWEITKILVNKSGKFTDKADAIQFISPIQCTLKPTPYVVDQDGNQVYTSRFRTIVLETEIDTIYHAKKTETVE